MTGRTPANSHQWKYARIWAESTAIEGRKPGEPEAYYLTIPYIAPRAAGVFNQRVSPVEICNAELAKRSGAARDSYLKTGGTVAAREAYALRVESRWELWPGGAGYKEPYGRSFQNEALADAVIDCRPLYRAPPPLGPILPAIPSPTVSEATLRMEAAQPQVVGGQLCPTQLRLYGQVQTIRAFEGKAVIFGPGYFSPVTALTFAHGGNRNVVASYPLRWNQAGGLAGSGANTLRRQTVSLTMNVTDLDNKVMKQAKETVVVTCKLVAQTVPAMPAEPAGPKPAPKPRLTTPPATVGFSWDRPAAAAPAAASFAGPLHPGAGGARLLPGIDLSIRLADRKGPGGATRLFLRNGGDAPAGSCRLMARKGGGAGEWIEIQSWEAAPAPAGKQKPWLANSFRFQAPPGATAEVTADLPRDPNLEFAVDCPDEPSDRLGNNLARLP